MTAPHGSVMAASPSASGVRAHRDSREMARPNIVELELERRHETDLAASMNRQPPSVTARAGSDRRIVTEAKAAARGHGGRLPLSVREGHSDPDPPARRGLSRERGPRESTSSPTTSAMPRCRRAFAVHRIRDLRWYRHYEPGPTRAKLLILDPLLVRQLRQRAAVARHRRHPRPSLRRAARGRTERRGRIAP